LEKQVAQRGVAATKAKFQIPDSRFKRATTASVDGLRVETRCPFVFHDSVRKMFAKKTYDLAAQSFAVQKLCGFFDG
jgi:hypothetical protein